MEVFKRTRYFWCNVKGEETQVCRPANVILLYIPKRPVGELDKSKKKTEEITA